MKPKIKQTGFTLIEVVVVVFILAIMAGLSFFAINQAGDRRYSNQAQDFLAWLQQLSDMAMLEGTAYGISQSTDSFEAVVFFNNNWYGVSSPESFRFKDEAALGLIENSSNEIRLLSQGKNNAQILPEIVMLPDGYMEPAFNLSLRFEDFSPTFQYQQDTSGLSMLINRDL